VIRLRVRLHADGSLGGFHVSGHAGAGGKGSDVVCAAVTVLLRTTARLLAAQPELKVEGGSPQEGVMHLSLPPPPQAKLDWVRGVTATLLAGLTDLAAEHPGRLELKIEGAARGEDRHGT
jgi:hypothetical protein